MDKIKGLFRRGHQPGPQKPVNPRSSVDAPAEPFSVPLEFQGNVQQWMLAEQHYLQAPSLQNLKTSTAILTHIHGDPRFTRTSESFRAFILNELGAALHRSYQFKGELDDLTASLGYWEEAARLAPSGPLLLICLNNLGLALRARYMLSGNLDDLQKAIEHYEKAIQQTPDDSPDLLARLNNLGNALRMRYTRIGDEKDLQQSIEAYKKSVRLTHIYSPDLPVRLNNLGRVLLVRYDASGVRGDLDRAVDTLEQAVRLVSPNSPDAPLCLDALGSGLLYRYMQDGDAKDLHRSIELLEKVVHPGSDNSYDMSMYFNDLGNSLKQRYHLTGRLEDLNRAIESHEKAVELAPARSPDRPTHLTNLGEELRLRYACTGHLSELERAIEVCKEAIALTPSDSPDLALRLTNLGRCLTEHYDQTSDPEDLDQAVQIHEEALNKIPSDSPLRPTILNDLATSFLSRSDHTRELEDLNKAVDLAEEATRSASAKDPLQGIYFNTLSGAFFDRHTLTGELRDLQRSITANEKAMELASLDSSERSLFVSNLGNKLRFLYDEYTHDPKDLQRAIQLSTEAVQNSSADSPLLPQYKHGLGDSLLGHYLLSHEQDDLTQAIQIYDEALNDSRHFSQFSPLAYQLGQQTQRVGLYVNAALAYIYGATVWSDQARDLRMKALTAIDASKSRLLATMLSRRQIPAPPTIPVHLVERERSLIKELADLDAAVLARHGQSVIRQNEINRQEQLHQWAEQRKALESLWDEMESDDQATSYVALRRGYQLDPNDITRLSEDLGQETALVSLALLPDRALLLGLQAGWEAPQVVETSLEYEAGQSMMRRFLREVHGFDGTGRRGETWYAPLKGLLEQMTPYLRSTQHVVFVPHFGGHFLPWGVLAYHAGWEAAVTTAPALGVLQRIVHPAAVPVSGSEPLVVGNPTGDLPYAEEEAVEVAKVLNAMPRVRGMATRKDVLGLLKAGVVGMAHFATHAYFAPGSPLDSGIVLADGILTAREILEREVRMPEFVVLSACQSGMTQALGGDEIAGLSQVLLYAGARSLLLSLWKVDDSAAAYLMTEFYRNWRVAGLDKAVALKKAMESTRQARPEWTHTYYWGAFTLVGDWR